MGKGTVSLLKSREGCDSYRDRASQDEESVLGLKEVGATITHGATALEESLKRVLLDADWSEVRSPCDRTVSMVPTRPR